jgi:ferrochelatase
VSGASPLGVALLNLGAPESESRIPAYLRGLLSDPSVMPLPWPARPLAARLIARRRAGTVARHYRAIGGRSPLFSQTRSQVEALRAALGGEAVVRYIFRHSAPRAAEVLSAMADAGVRRVVAVPAYPQWTRSTSGSAAADLQRAARRAGVQVRCAGSFPDAPGYIEALACLTLPHLSASAWLLLSAHGLPMRTIRGGDPYLQEVGRTVDALARRLPAGTRYSLAFQSRVGPMAWTGPALGTELLRLGRSGVRALVVAPISFVCENLETVYELDIELAALARECGITTFCRVPAPGCHPAFISEIARLVRRTAREAGWEVQDGS